MSKTLYGTYLWNEVVNPLSQDQSEPIFNENVNASIATSGRRIQAIQVVMSQQASVNIFYVGTDVGGTGVDSFKTYDGTWHGKGNRTITFNSDTTVSNTFYDWFITNTQSVELCELSGRWKWNDIPAYHTRDFDIVKMNFKSGFTDMEYMLVYPDEQGLSSDIAYMSQKFRHEAYGNMVNGNRGWIKPAFGIIDFGDDIQLVTKEFYDWFTANATEQTLVEIRGVWSLNDDIIKTESEDWDSFDLTGTWRWKFSLSESIAPFTAELADVKVNWDISNVVYSLNKLVVTSNNFSMYYWLPNETLAYSNGWEFQAPSEPEIIFGKDYSVKLDGIAYDEFCEWLAASAERIDTIADEVDTEIYEPVSFKTYVDNKSYAGIRMLYKNTELSTTMDLYYATYYERNELVAYTQVYRVNTWINESTNRTIDFGDTSQLVSSEFYEWLTANAMEASYEISGLWTFNKELSEYPSTPITISGERWFINVAERSKLSLDPHGLNGKFTIKYDDLLVFYDGEWVDDYYRVLRIVGSIRVPAAFYRWFMDNAEREQLLIDKSTLIDIGDAIRAKTGKTEAIKVSDLANEIAKITTASNGIVSVSIREIK